METHKKELNQLNQRRQILVRREDKTNGLTNPEEKKQLQDEIADIVLKCKYHQMSIIKILTKKQNKDNIKKEENKMEEKLNSAKKNIRVGRQTQKDSLATHIEAALLNDDLKDIDAIVEYVNEKKPTDSNKIKRQLKAILYQIKKGVQKRWEKYSLDEANYKIILK